MSDEQKTRDRYLRLSRALVVSVHLVIILMSLTIVYFEIINTLNMSKVEMSKGWWAASIISIVCQATTVGCVIFAIVAIFLDFETLSSWFMVIPVTGVSIALLASLSLAIPTMIHNFPNSYASDLFNEYSNDGQFWRNLKDIEESYSCCGVRSIGDYQVIGAHGKAQGYCARRLKLIQFSAAEEGFIRSIRWDFDLVFNTSNYNRVITKRQIPIELVSGGGYAAFHDGFNESRQKECQATAFRFKDKLEDWSRRLQAKLEARMGEGMNNFTMSPSCGQLMGQMAANSRRLFLYTAGAWFLITLACLAGFFYGRLKYAVFKQHLVQQVVQPVQPQAVSQPQPQVYSAPVYAPPVYAPPVYAPPQPYLTPRSSFNSIDGFDMFSTDLPSYYRHPAQNIPYYNPNANYPRDPRLGAVSQAPAKIAP